MEHICLSCPCMLSPLPPLCRTHRHTHHITHITIPSRSQPSNVHIIIIIAHIHRPLPCSAVGTQAPHPCTASLARSRSAVAPATSPSSPSSPPSIQVIVLSGSLVPLRTSVVVRLGS